VISQIKREGPAVLLTNTEFRWGASTDSFRLRIDHFQLDKEESNILVGPSGSGKSTLLGIICGTLKPQEGETRVLGQRLEEMGDLARDRFRADNIGMIFQQFNLLPYLSAIDNVLLPLNFSVSKKQACGLTQSECYSEAEKLLETLGIDIKTTAKQKAVELSIGQQQRVAAARAFIGSPQLIIADEPTSSLDEEIQSVFLDQLFSQKDRTGSSLLMVSHNPRIAERFDTVTELDKISNTQS
jgi:putative ABC transport system ATP-binding protein